MATVSHEAYLTEESEIADVSRLLFYKFTRSETKSPTRNLYSKSKVGEIPSVYTLA
ncbi:hypothetical protein DPMN_065315 [Dreissena polymorpha]|uniref:Uncharacterized protein n=1 Tax=Dreissena polymorpha TaxID=45954 RepID=A0A9D4HL00_DREPO|nr:hypothetical protein DPMN_065315 [Dreissena polymorpha]